MPQRDLTTIAQLEAATRGEGAFASDAPSTCYLVHDGRYLQNGTTLAMYVKVGGTDASHRRLFIGQSRAGVVIRGRATIDAGVSHVRLTNMTFDLTGYTQSGSFNTVSLLANSTDVRLDHLTFTGDCATGANGGHVEVDGSSDVVLEASVIEKFGRCGPTGHQDHGVYLGSGADLVIRNNDIRENASRGIQLNTEGGSFGTLSRVTIENNRIHSNGHATYEDGIVLNATGTGTISNVTVRNNVIDSNFYSGVRFVGTVFQNVVVTKNTFYRNGGASTAAGRSEANLDDVGSGANAVFSKNLFVAQNRVVNDCYDSQPRGFSIADNKGTGTVPSGAAGNCVSNFVTADPMFVNAVGGDFHPMSGAVNGYGAYSP